MENNNNITRYTNIQTNFQPTTTPPAAAAPKPSVVVVNERHVPTPLARAKGQVLATEKGIKLHIERDEKLPTNIDFEEVTTLVLSFNKVVTDAELAEFLKKTPNLRVLELKHSSLSLAGAKLPPFLKVLDLEVNRAVTDVTLASALKDCKHLERLLLRGALVSLANMQLSDTLIELDLQICNNVTDAALMHAIANCKHLKTLNLSFCSKIKLENVLFGNALINLDLFNSIQKQQGVTKKTLVNSLLNVNMDTLKLRLPTRDKDYNIDDIKAEVKWLQSPTYKLKKLTTLLNRNRATVNKKQSAGNKELAEGLANMPTDMLNLILDELLVISKEVAKTAASGGSALQPSSAQGNVSTTPNFSGSLASRQVVVISPMLRNC